MDDYIKRKDALIAASEDEGFGISIRRRIRQIPAADVRENIHGNWVGIDDFPYEVFECDRCGYIIEFAIKEHLANFCPNCGADMRGEKE